jgi:hypothetical protein
VTPAEKLCLACGLCCDGTLFGHVKLGPADDVKRLKTLGLPVAVTRGRTPVTHFPQRCAALCTDCTCRVYADRPRQCRTFECGVFQAAQAGRITFPAARRTVKKARRQADRVRQLLLRLGDTEHQRALSERFHRTQRRLESGRVDAAAADTFAELSQAMHTLDLLTHEKFHTKAAARR